MSQQFSVAFGQEGSDVTTTTVIPANSQIISIDINVETALMLQVLIYLILEL
jgi:hypothetical protein